MFKLRKPSKYHYDISFKSLILGGIIKDELDITIQKIAEVMIFGNFELRLDLHTIWLLNSEYHNISKKIILTLNAARLSWISVSVLALEQRFIFYTWNTFC